MRFSTKLALATVFFFLLAVTTTFINLGDTNPVKEVSGQTVSIEICGFAWGATDEDANPGDGVDTGVGWLSFNSKDCDSNGDGTIDNSLCGSGSISNYKVVATNASGNFRLEGNAWSPNIGWVKFGGLDSATFPPANNAAAGTLAVWNGNAEIVQTDNSAPSDMTLMEDLKLRGWARACGGTTGGDCNSANRADWQGFISLGNHGWAGQNAAIPTHQISIRDGVFSGYSWDPYVAGWMNWGVAGSMGVRFCNVEGPDFSIEADPSVINASPDTAIDEIVVVEIDNFSDADFPEDGVSLSVSNPSGVSSSFTSNSSCSAGDIASNGSCALDLRVTSAGLPIDETRTITITGTAEGLGGSTITHQATVTIVVGAVAGSLRVDCPMPVSHDQQVAEIYYVNRPVVWRVDASGENGYAPIGNLFYTPFYDGVAGAEQQNGTFTRSYSTLGRKTFSASVRDSAVPPAEGECEPREIVIRVNPDIIER